MAISNLTTGLRPGVCTSLSRPTAPYEGQVIYETDTDKALVWNGSAWFYLSTPQATEIGVWETWTPTVASSGGTLGSFTINSARYARIQKTIFCSFDITITAVGTGSGSLNITLPITAVAGQAGKGVGVWRERSVTGDMGFVNFATTTLAFIQRYDQGAILNTGRTLAGTFTYEAA